MTQPAARAGHPMSRSAAAGGPGTITSNATATMTRPVTDGVSDKASKVSLDSYEPLRHPPTRTAVSTASAATQSTLTRYSAVAEPMTSAMSTSGPSRNREAKSPVSADDSTRAPPSQPIPGSTALVRCRPAGRFPGPTCLFVASRSTEVLTASALGVAVDTMAPSSWLDLACLSRCGPPLEKPSWVPDGEPTSPRRTSCLSFIVMTHGPLCGRSGDRKRSAPRSVRLYAAPCACARMIPTTCVHACGGYGPCEPRRAVLATAACHLVWGFIGQPPVPLATLTAPKSHAASALCSHCSNLASGVSFPHDVGSDVTILGPQPGRPRLRDRRVRRPHLLFLAHAQGSAKKCCKDKPRCAACRVVLMSLEKLGYAEKGKDKRAHTVEKNIPKKSCSSRGSAEARGLAVS